jgi:hypothetical protein
MREESGHDYERHPEVEKQPKNPSAGTLIDKS